MDVGHDDEHGGGQHETEIAWPWTTRAMPDQAKNEMTPITTGRLGPSTAASAKASTR